MTDISPEGTFYTQAFPVEKPKDIESYQEKANPVLKEYGKKIVSKGQFDFMKALIGVLVALLLLVGWLGMSDKFKSEVNTSCPNISIPACPVQEIPACPPSTCEVTCGEVNIPSNLTLRLVNGSN